MAQLTTPAITSEGRLFIRASQAGCDNYTFANCVTLDGLSKTFGSIEPVYCPDPNTAKGFVEVATIRGSEERWTSSLAAMLGNDGSSILYDLAKARCAFDLQVHFGSCSAPDDFAGFDWGYYLTDVIITDYSTEKLTALNPSEAAVIMENSSISMGDVFKLKASSLSEVGAAVGVDGAIVGIAACNSVNCGDCNLTNSGCDFVFGLRAGTDSEIIYSSDGGSSWNSYQTGFSTNTSDDGAGGIDCTASYVTWALVTDNGVLRVRTQEVVDVLNGSQDIKFTADRTGWPLARFVRKVSVFDNTIYVLTYNNDDIVFTKTPLTQNNWEDTAAFVSGENNFQDMHITEHGVLLSEFDGRELYWSTDYTNFTAINWPFTNGPQAVWVFSENNWLVNGEGTMYCTVNGGQTWTTWTGIAPMVKMEFIGDIGYGVYNDNFTTSDPHIYKTYDRGRTWVELPDNGANTNLPVHVLLDVAVCENDPNTYWAGGVDVDGGISGLIVTGS